MTKRQDPCEATELPYDFRIEQANARRAQAESGQAQNADRSLTESRGADTYMTAVFAKTLPHNSFGEVLVDDFMRIEIALRAGEQKWFDLIQRDSAAVRKLVNPQAALAFSMEGADSHGLTIPPAPSMVSAEAAAEMVEVYGKAILRDASFRDIQNGSTGMPGNALDLISDLNSFGTEFTGPKEGGVVTNGTLFRGTGPGETVGPYVSQFLLHDFEYGNMQMSQVLETENDSPTAISVSGWLDIQRGITPPGANKSGNLRRIHNPRALGSYVHNDPILMAYYNACLILLTNGAAFDANIPSLANEDHFATLGLADVITRTAHVCQLALKAAWHQKWNVNMRLRPEVMAGRVHFTLLEGEDYNLDAGLLGSNTVANMRAINAGNSHDTYLLPLIYPEGSPAHPSYPAGHATMAGAATTVLKAFFDDNQLMTSLASGAFKIVESVTGTETMQDLLDNAITDPAVTNTLTVSMELNKLASNIALGRDMAGVHYRSDGDQGLRLGEKVAIQYLKDVASTYNEDFAGFTFTSFDGTPVVVSP